MLQAMINLEYTCNLEIQNWIPSHHTCIQVWNLVCILSEGKILVTKDWQVFFFSPETVSIKMTEKFTSWRLPQSVIFTKYSDIILSGN